MQQQTKNHEKPQKLFKKNQETKNKQNKKQKQKKL